MLPPMTRIERVSAATVAIRSWGWVLDLILGDENRETLTYVRADDHGYDRGWDDDSADSQAGDDQRSPGFVEVVGPSDGEGAAAFGCW